MSDDNQEQSTKVNSWLTYEEILRRRDKSNNLPALLDTRPQLGLIASSGDANSLVASASKVMPKLQREMIANEDLLLGLSTEEKTKWLALTEEAVHATKTMPRRRTMSEKRGSVLQQNRFPTAASKFHQAKFEQAAYVGMYMEQTYSYKEQKIELEKSLYRRQKLEDRIAEYGLSNKDTFLLEKKLELLEIKIVKAITSLDACLVQANEYRKEIEEWSILKQECYQEAQNTGEMWSPDEIDNLEGLQEVALARRHLTNYLMLLNNGENGDISSVMNIEGLALTAIREGVKSTKLGLILDGLSDEQTDAVWQRVYGRKSDIKRTDMTVTVWYGGQNMTFLTNPVQFREVMKLRANPEFLQQLLAQANVQKGEPAQEPEVEYQVVDETDLAFDKIITNKSEK